jgi:TonB family protein
VSVARRFPVLLLAVAAAAAHANGAVPAAAPAPAANAEPEEWAVALDLADATRTARRGESEEVGAAQPLATGSWRARLVRGPATVVCPGSLEPQCSAVDLIIENASRNILECSAKLTLADRREQGAVTRAAVILPASYRTALHLALPATVSVASHEAHCQARPALPPLGNWPKCEPHWVRGGRLDDYYPDISLRRGEAGPVMIQVTLTRPEGHPGSVSVVGSSLFEHLDKAAVRYVENSVYAAPCPGTTWRFPVNFELAPETPAAASSG